MATRLYGVPTTAAPVSPAFGTGWTTTAAAVRRSLSITKSGTAEVLTNVAVTSGVGNNALAFQLISEPLSGAQTITGTATIVTRGRELAAQDNIGTRARQIRVYSGDGATLRGTLLAPGTHSVTTELGTVLAGYPAASATALSSVSAQDGDRIVVELGYGMATTGTTPLYDMAIGGTGTDHANSEGDGTGTVPWIEFSQNLTFQTPPAGNGPTYVSTYSTVFDTTTTPKTTSAFNGSSGDVLVSLAADNIDDGAENYAWSSSPTETWTEGTESTGVTSSDTFIQGAHAILSAARTGMTVSVARSAGAANVFGHMVAHFTGSNGIGTVVASSGAGVSLPNVSFTTQYDNSAIVYLLADFNATANARTHRSGGIEIAYYNGNAAATYSVVGGYIADAGTAGVVSVGLSAPTGRWQIVAYEVRNSSGGAPFAPRAQPRILRQAVSRASNW